MCLQRKFLAIEIQAHSGHEGVPTIQPRAYAKYVISGPALLQPPSQPRKIPLCFAAVFKRCLSSGLL